MIKTELVIPQRLVKIYDDFNYDIESVFFLIIVFFHYNKKISDEKLTGMFKSLKDGSLNRFVNTYHCKINDQWYDHMSMIHILKEIYFDYGKSLKDIPMEDFLRYINKYQNKPRNYCVNHLYLKFIQPIVEQYQSNSWGSTSRFSQIEYLLEDFGFDLNLVKYDTYDYDFGYCCEDCDGDRKTYVDNHFNHYVVPQNIKTMKDKIFKVMDGFRTKDYQRNDGRLILT